MIQASPSGPATRVYGPSISTTPPARRERADPSQSSVGLAPITAESGMQMPPLPHVRGEHDVNARLPQPPQVVPADQVQGRGVDSRHDAPGRTRADVRTRPRHAQPPSPRSRPGPTTQACVRAGSGPVSDSTASGHVASIGERARSSAVRLTNQAPAASAAPTLSTAAPGNGRSWRRPRRSRGCTLRVGRGRRMSRPVLPQRHHRQRCARGVRQGGAESGVRLGAGQHVTGGEGGLRRENLGDVGQRHQPAGPRAKVPVDHDVRVRRHPLCHAPTCPA